MLRDGLDLTFKKLIFKNCVRVKQRTVDPSAVHDRQEDHGMKFIKIKVTQRQGKHDSKTRDTEYMM